MKKTYADLDLKSIREALDIDFAHFTYKPSQCSCCYGPQDLAAKYWKNNTIQEGDDYSYILFKNAHNGSGSVTKFDNIGYANISWGNLSDTQLDGVVTMLQEQLGSDYKVVKPENKRVCINIEYEGK
jgi:hypothetical protein